jgi:CBS domain-containing protein
MSHRVTHVSLDDTVEHCVQVMAAKHIRHLPVLEKHRLVGVLSMRDLLTSRAAMNAFVMEQLSKGPAAAPPAPP